MTDGGYTKDEAWNLQLQAKIARLETALKPFAAEFERHTDCHNDGFVVPVRMGELRRAHAALTDGSKQEVGK